LVLVLAEHGGGVPLVDDQDAVEELAADAADERSAIPLARGARTGDLTIRTSMTVNTASYAAVNLASRSRVKNRERRPTSSRSMTRLRACGINQAPVGWAVTPRMCTRRVACSMTKLGRSAAAPPAGHAWPPAAANGQVTGCARSFGHPQERHVHDHGLPLEKVGRCRSRAQADWNPTGRWPTVSVIGACGGGGCR
jgi:hypothetical protein